MAFWRRPSELADAEAALAAGEPLEATRRLCARVDYPGHLEGTRAWKAAFDLLARIARTLDDREIERRAKGAARRPDDPQVLYDLGFALIERELGGFAATVLARADAAAPGSEAIVTELVVALELIGSNEEACRRLRASSLPDTSWLCRYLLAFNSIMSGDLAEAARIAPTLMVDPGEHVELARRIQGMLARADGVRDATALDARDLRGWHLVLNGAILLHTSPFGFDDGMAGRYAYTQDSNERCVEGLRRLAIALEAMELRPPRVFVLGERGSAILGRAAARILDLPAVAWRLEPDGRTPEEPGLIVVYDLADLEEETRRSLFEHRPGQILFAHATSWTSDPPFAADVTTYLYQANAAPWGERLRVDPDRQKVDRVAPSDAPTEVLVEQLVAARPGDDDLAPADLEALRGLARAAAGVAEVGRPGAMCVTGGRTKPCSGSPVKSSRFA